MGLPGTVRRVQLGARQCWELTGAIATACICALPKLWGGIVNTLCCFTPRHPHLSGVRQGLWNSIPGCCTSALSATSISACVQVVGPDPGYVMYLAGPAHPGKTGLVVERPNVCGFAEAILLCRMKWKSFVVFRDGAVQFPLWCLGAVFQCLPSSSIICAFPPLAF